MTRDQPAAHCFSTWWNKAPRRILVASTLRAGASPPEAGQGGQTLVHLAAALKGADFVVPRLPAFPGGLHVRDEAWQIPLQLALYNPDHEVLPRLLEA